MKLKLKRRSKGILSATALAVIMAIVSLFIGLFMISKVSSVASINNSSDFYSTYQSLVSNTGTIYDVLILVLIVAALGVALAFLKGFAGGGGTPTAARM